MVGGPGHKAVELFEAVHRGDPRTLGARHQPGSLPARRQPGARGAGSLRAAGGLRGDRQHRHGASRPPAAARRRLGRRAAPSPTRSAPSAASAPSCPAGEARPDWWALTQLARRLGFGEGFAYEHEHDIFCEHAALSGFENQGQRQFDISGLARLSRAEFEALAPLSWPVNAAWPSSRARLFEDGRFATPDGRARLLPLAQFFPRARSGAAAGGPLLVA